MQGDTYVRRELRRDVGARDDQLLSALTAERLCLLNSHKRNHSYVYMHRSRTYGKARRTVRSLALVYPTHRNRSRGIGVRSRVTRTLASSVARRLPLSPCSTSTSALEKSVCLMPVHAPRRPSSQCRHSYMHARHRHQLLHASTSRCPAAARATPPRGRVSRQSRARRPLPGMRVVLAQSAAGAREEPRSRPCRGRSGGGVSKEEGAAELRPVVSCHVKWLLGRDPARI